MEQKSRSLARKGIADIFARPGHREFFLDLASNPQTRHLFHISRVEIGGACAAANFGIVFGDCYYHVLASYDGSDVSHYGPGALHLRELMAHAISMGLKRFDFTIGDEPYKLEWSDTDSQIVRLRRHRELARLAGANCFDGAAPRQTLYQADTVGVAARFPRQVRRSARYRTRCSRFRLPPRSRSFRGVRGEACDCRLRHGRHGFVAAAGIGRYSLRRRHAGAACLRSIPVTRNLAWSGTDYTKNSEALVDALGRASARPSPNPRFCFYEEDAQVLLVSRHRERLAPGVSVRHCRPNCWSRICSTRHASRSSRNATDLPVPAGRRFDPAAIESADLGLAFPLIVKPLTRLERWNNTFGLRKAIYVESAEALRSLWPQFREVSLDLLAQEFIPGAEGRIESYHCYVDGRGDIAGGVHRPKDPHLSIVAMATPPRSRSPRPTMCADMDVPSWSAWR